jgi:hypothetical protein
MSYTIFKAKDYKAPKDIARDVARVVFKEYEFLHVLYGISEQGQYAQAYNTGSFNVYCQFFNQWFSLKVYMSGFGLSLDQSLSTSEVERISRRFCRSQQDFITGRHLGIVLQQTGCANYVGQVNLQLMGYL